LPREFTYAEAGVDRKRRAESKKTLRVLKETYKHSLYGKVIQLPYGNVLPLQREWYMDLQIEGIGTKVLIAQLANKYDTIGIDGVAMVVNDVIRSGARPMAIVDNIHAHVSDPDLVKKWMTGLMKGAAEARCVIPNGEIGDVPELIKGLVDGKGFDMVVAAVGEVRRERLITGRNIRKDDSIVGLRSSGLHSNGVSLARKVLFKQWGGKYELHDTPENIEREIVSEVLEPTRIYVKSVLRTAEEIEVKAAVHITGEGYAKFGRLAKFSKGIGFEFNNFKPHPIFELVQKTASNLGGMITDEEMFRTFNMGWGFAVIVDKAETDNALSVFEQSGVHAEKIGQVTSSTRIEIIHKRKRIVLR